MDEEKEFSAIERIIMLPLIPRKGYYYNIKKVREVKEELGFNDEEVKILTDNTTALPNNKSQTDWNAVNSQIKVKAVDLGEWISNDIKIQLQKIHNDENITEDHLRLYEMFVLVDEEVVVEDEEPYQVDGAAPAPVAVEEESKEEKLEEI